MKNSSNNEIPEKIETYRKKIDKIDRKLIRLLLKRMENAKVIGKVKKSKGLPINNEDRENKILKSIDKLSNSKNLTPYVKTVYKTIFKVSKEIEKEIKDERF